MRKIIMDVDTGTDDAIGDHGRRHGAPDRGESAVHGAREYQCGKHHAQHPQGGLCRRAARISPSIPAPQPLW